MTWERLQAGSSESVRKAYVRSRLREINSKGNREALIDETLEALKAHVPALAKAGYRGLPENAGYRILGRAYRQITSRLQGANLTINFRAPGWFTEENSSESYLQMYERGVRGGRMVLTNKDPLNLPRQRVQDDDVATLPDGWKEAPRQAARGLAPEVGRGRMADKLSPGKLKRNDKGLSEYDPDQEFVASNVQFDPYAKQVFAALNYGRRPHGSSTLYGHSYMVLDDKFKANALYFAGDTFEAGKTHLNSAKHQVSYDLLGGLLLKAWPNQLLRDDLIKSCLQCVRLPDTAEEHRLVEAHLFEKVAFRGNITHLYISAKDRPKDALGNEKDWTGDLFTRVRENARNFAVKHGAKIIWID